MIRDSIRAALAAAVLWPMMPPATPSVVMMPPAPTPAPPSVVMMPPAPPSVVMMPPPAPPAGPVARVIGAADRVAARFLPPL